MAKALKKRLPKNFEDLLKQALVSDDLTKVQAVFETCDINARGGYGEATALMMSECSPALAKWLIVKGADINAVNIYGDTPLSQSIRVRYENHLPPHALIDLGADIHLSNNDGCSPLHVAADAKNLEALTLLLSRGAVVDALSTAQLTPLEYALRRVSNIGLIEMVPIAKALLAAGARSSQESQAFVKRASENFEFHRAGFNTESVEETSQAVQALCELFHVEPQARRQMHDGTSPIMATGKTWQEQFESLWQAFVPSSGAAETIQGEVVRLAGKLSHQLVQECGEDWDKDFRAMLLAWLKHLSSNNALSDAELTEAKAIVALGRNADEQAAIMPKLSLAWVKLNPIPIKLPKPSYCR
jgi:ankyrin repeat protein